MAEPMSWTDLSAQVKYGDVRGYSLVAVVYDAKEFGYLALLLATAGATAREVLGHHQHQLVGAFDTEKEAKEAAETAMKEWQSADEECLCGEP